MTTKVLSLAFVGTHLKPFDSSSYFQPKKEVGFYVGFGSWDLSMVDLGEFSRVFLVSPNPIQPPKAQDAVRHLYKGSESYLDTRIGGGSGPGRAGLVGII